MIEPNERQEPGLDLNGRKHIRKRSKKKLLTLPNSFHSFPHVLPNTMDSHI